MQTIEQVVKDLKTDKETNNKINLTGLPSGIQDLDKQTLGFQNGKLTIIAGKPRMGTTTFAFNIARYNAQVNNNIVAVFSLDQANLQLMNSIILNSEPEDSFYDFVISDENQELSIMKFGKTPIYIDETQCISIFELMEKAYSLKTEHGINLLIIDYLQIITGFDLNTRDGENRNYEKITRLLNFLAKSLNIPVILVSHLDRIANERIGGCKKPILHDLYAFGEIEKQADLILLLYRWVCYGIVEDESGEDLTKQALIIIVKNMNGQLGEVKFNFDTTLI